MITSDQIKMFIQVGVSPRYVDHLSLVKKDM